jgi:hypothetical protein
MTDIAEMPQWLIDLIREKAKDPTNFGKGGRLCIAPGVYVRNWLTDKERRLLEESSGGTS